MTKCLLHIGMHKTGTTSIQYSLQGLNAGGFYYARVRGKPNHSNSIAAIFAEGDTSHVVKKSLRKGRGDIDEVKREARRDLKASIEAAAGGTLVISGEGILRMTGDEVERMKAYLLRKGCTDIQVMGYVRPPASYISSALQQKIKTGHLTRFNLMSSVPGYRKAFEKFDRIFGRENVSLHKFEPAAFPDGDVVVDFCQKAGIAPGTVTPIRKNDSISRLGAQLLFQYAQRVKNEGLRPMRGSMGLLLAGRLKDIDPAPFRLAPSALTPTLEAIRGDVAWMEERLGAPLQEPAGSGQPGDVHSEDDLLVPVPDLEGKLRGLLGEDAGAIDENEAGSAWDLAYHLAFLEARAKRARPDDEDGEEDRSAGRAERKPARRRAGRDEDPGRAARRAERRAGRVHNGARRRAAE